MRDIAYRWFHRFYDSGWLVLFATMLMWGANVVAGRLAVGQISPMSLVSFRWLIVCVIMLPLQRAKLAGDIEALKGHLPLLLIGGALGFTGFNALFYVAAHHTNGVNIAIIQGSVPIFTMAGAFLVFGARFSLVQIIGLLMTLLGVVLVAIKGSLANLSSLQFNIGDLFLLIASAFYAAYALALRNRPNVSSLGLFAIMAGIAFLTSLPLLFWDIVAGDFFWPTPKGLAILLYVAICPSLLSQIWFIRGVQLIGPARAGLFINLLPVFGAILSIIFLGEYFAFYHAVALALVIAGIYIAEQLGKKEKSGKK